MEVKEFTRIEKIGFLSLLIDELKHSLKKNRGICFSNTFLEYIGLRYLLNTKFPELNNLINYRIEERIARKNKLVAFGWDNNKERIKDLKILMNKLITDNMNLKYIENDVMF